jgi:hypothetical protein
LVPDVVFYRRADGSMDWVHVPAPTREELADLAVRIKVRVERLLGRMKLAVPGEEGADDGAGDEEDVLAGWQGAGIVGRVGVGARAGWPVKKVRGEEVAMAPRGQGLCADAGCYNLHAGVHVGAGQRGRLESLIRYMLRPPLAKDRLRILADGRVEVKLKRPYGDGTRALVYEPMDFIGRLCSMVPPPRAHMVHYYGLFAPHAAARSAVVPEGREQGPEEAARPVQKTEGEEAERGKEVRKRSRRRLWAELMKRTFEVDVLACECGGRLRLIGFVFDREALAEIKECVRRGRGGVEAKAQGPPGGQEWLPGVE